MAAPWISADEAQALLGVKIQTLQSYADRGLIERREDPEDFRHIQYSLQDVHQLLRRKAVGVKTAGKSDEATDPVVSTRITTILDDRPWYRGRDAVAWSDRATLEDTARLLWDCTEDPFLGLAPHPSIAVGSDARARAFSVLAYRAASDTASAGRAEKVLKREAASVLIDLVDAMCGASRNGLIHERLAKTWRLEGPRIDILRRCLVLCADHELGPSTYAARIAASTGASVAACVLSGLSTLSGPLHGGMTLQVAAFVAECRRTNDPRAAAALRLSQGLEVPGFGQNQYPMGDPRARAIAQSLNFADDLREIAHAGESVTGVAPNLDFALVAATRTLGLPVDAAFTLFVIGRTVGWIAHALEQRETSRSLRPRTAYIGQRPGYLDPAREEPEPATEAKIISLDDAARAAGRNA